MQQTAFEFKSKEGTDIYVYHWAPEEGVQVKGIVQIAHGMAETAGRYKRFAQALTDNGYIVYANDHRGHGKTAKTVESLGHLAEADGFYWMVEDVHQLSQIIKQKNPDLPLFLFGHSMGSFVTQRYLMLYGKELKGAILSGSNGKQGLMLHMGAFLAKQEVKKHGRKAKSEKLNKLSFGSFNNAFKPNRTEFDWLSRDAAEVDKYIQDPYCGTVFTCGFFYDFMTGLKEIEKDSNVELVPKELPIYIFSGDKDPVGKMGNGVRRLYDAYKRHYLADVTMRLYPEGRHEMLNETNKEEVMKDVVDWLNKHI